MQLCSWAPFWKREGGNVTPMGAVWGAGWDTHMCAGQELPHDVGIIHLAAPAQPVLLVVQFLILFYLDFRRLSTLAYSFLETSFI